MATLKYHGWEYLTALVIYVAFLLPAIWWYAFVLVQLWDWFAVPLGAPTVGIWHGYGLAILTGYLTKQLVPDDDPPIEGAVRWLVACVLRPALTLALAAAVASMMGGA